MKVPENHHVDTLNNLISYLFEDLPHVLSFKGKWSIIRTKLSDLQSHLSDSSSDLPTFSSTPLCTDLLRSVSCTLHDAVSLAKRCRNPNPTEGKLRTQSDIDSVNAKLDAHIRDAEILIRSGVLRDGVVLGGNSGSGSGSGESTSSKRREAVRAESRSLITRLQIGSQGSKNSVMDSLLDLIQEDDKNVLIAVAQGIVPVLVRSLDSSCVEMKEKAVSAISRVSMVDSTKHVLINEGLFLLNHLLRVLESGSGLTKEKACVTLRALTFSRENAMAVGSRGGISSLLEICHHGTPGSQAVAAGVLRNLASFQETRANFMEENAVSVLLGLLASGTANAQENVIGCFCNLVADDVNFMLLIAREGVIDCLNNFWDVAPAIQSLEVAVQLLRILASCPAVAELIVSNGFVTRLMLLLNCGVPGVRIATANTIYELGCSTKTRKEMGEFGCVLPLIVMLDGKAIEEKEAAVKALSNLLVYAGNRKIFRTDERGIVGIVHLLDPSIKNLDKRYPISALASMVHSKKCKKQMVNAGACLHLQKLADMSVDGARKLLESLSHGKIWSVFGRP